MLPCAVAVYGTESPTYQLVDHGSQLAEAEYLPINSTVTRTGSGHDTATIDS